MRLLELFSPTDTIPGTEWRLRYRNALGGAVYEVKVENRDKQGNPVLDDAGNPEILNFSLDFAASPVAGIYQVSFVLIKDKTITFEMTKTGNEFRVLAVMGQAIKDFLTTGRRSKKTPVRALYFTASEPSRIRVYKRISQRIADTLKWKLDDELAHLFGGGWETEGAGFLIVNPKYRDVLKNQILQSYGEEN
jgi:hypothetical protein